MAEPMKIGCDKLHYALLTVDTDAALTYETPVPMPGVMTLSITANTDSQTAFYDDGPGEVATALGEIEVSIEKNALSAAEKNVLLGHQLDTNGAVIYGAEDIPPFVALGFRNLRTDGTYRYVWLYKGKFQEPEDSSTTKGDSIEFQNESITGSFVKVNKSFTVNGRTVTPWKSEVFEGTQTRNACAKWFTKVYQPGDNVAAE